MDAAALDVRRQLLAEVDRLAEQVEDPPQRGLADGDRDRGAGVDHLHAACEAVGDVHRHRPHAVIAEVLLDLAHEHALARAGADARGLLLCLGSGTRDRDRVVDLGQAVGEDGLDHDALDLLDAPDVARGGAVRVLGSVTVLAGISFDSLSLVLDRGHRVLSSCASEAARGKTDAGRGVLARERLRTQYAAPRSAPSATAPP